jgi:thiol-disulfide isomerase/thioredoxin
LCSALIVVGCAQKHPDVIEFPVFDTSNTNSIEIEKIEMSDSATILHFVTHFQGGWITIDSASYIRESGKDEKLLAISSEGISFNEQFYPSKEDGATFKLVFPPLKAKVTKIDFIESDCDKCFKFWGISLLPDTKLKFMKIPETIAVTELPEPGFSADSAIVSGKYFGYVKDNSAQEISFIYNDIVTGDKKTEKITIADDGSFKGKVGVNVPGLVYSSLGFPVFLTPGKEVKLNIDLKKKARFQSQIRKDKEPEDSIYAYIECSPLTIGELVSLASTINGRDQAAFFRRIMKDAELISEMKPDEYKAFLLDLAAVQEDSIGALPVSDNLKLLKKLGVQDNLLTYMSYYQRFKRSAIAKIKNIQDNKKVNEIQVEKPDLNYYDFIGKLQTDKFSYLFNFPGIVSQLVSIVSVDAEIPKAQFEQFTAKAAPLLGYDKGIIFDAVKANFYGAQISQMKFFTDAEKEEIKASFPDCPALSEKIIAENDKLQQLIEETKSNNAVVINEIPAVVDAALFDAILAKYKGKVVFVDFWATWCGPCVAGIEAMKATKDELQSKGVVYLYITGETSPLADWNRKIPEIHGEHYRLSNAQWKYVGEQVGINGIPHYMIYDKTGKKVSEQVGFSSEYVEKSKKELESLL